VVDAWFKAQSAQSGALIYPGRRSYSSEFYSRGMSENIKDPDEWPRNSFFYLSRRLRDSNADLPTGLGCVRVTENERKPTASLSLGEYWAKIVKDFAADWRSGL